MEQASNTEVDQRREGHTRVGHWSSGDNVRVVNSGYSQRETRGYPAEFTRNTMQLGTQVHYLDFTEQSRAAGTELDLDQSGPARLKPDGTILTGSGAEMESGGQLNPAHPRWLMGYPPEWDACAPTEMPSSRKSRQKL